MGLRESSASADTFISAFRPRAGHPANLHLDSWPMETVRQ